MLKTALLMIRTNKTFTVNDLKKHRIADENQLVTDY